MVSCIIVILQHSIYLTPDFSVKLKNGKSISYIVGRGKNCDQNGERVSKNETKKALFEN